LDLTAGGRNERQRCGCDGGIKHTDSMAFINLSYELEEIIKRKVDLVSKGGMKERYMRQLKTICLCLSGMISFCSDIIESIEKIEITLGLTLQDFLYDRKTKDAVARNFK
jgi:hypothetical protein